MHLGDGGLLRPSLVSGFIAAHRPTFSANGARVFAACGASVFCYSVRTSKQLAALPSHDGQVTAVCAGPSRSDCSACGPLATGTSRGELQVWDGSSVARLARLDVGAPILDLRWPSKERLVVAVGEPGGRASVRVANTEVLDSISLGDAVPIWSSKLQAFDATVTLDGRLCVVMCELSEIAVWREGWDRPKTVRSQHPITAVSTEPRGRYVAAGDKKGVVWTHWEVLSDDVARRNKPGRWHWHANPVRCLVHVGPLLLSGGDEGVLCIRQVEDEAVRFIPRFGAPLRHLAASPDGSYICISVSDNSLVILDDMFGNANQKRIQALEVPSSSVTAMHESVAARPVLQQLAGGKGTVVTSGARRIQFLDDRGRLQQHRTLIPSKTNTVVTERDGDPNQTWALWRVALGARASCAMTCERRVCPALQRFDPEAAEMYVLKWWRPNETGHFELHSIAHQPHIAEVTVSLAHPQREFFFVTASLDGVFKCWDLPEAGASGAGGRPCWQCVATGSWHGRPILSAALSEDGSTLALGYSGFVVLWEPMAAIELQALPLKPASHGRSPATNGTKVSPGGEQVQLRASQLFFAVACNRFLLMAVALGPGGLEETICWDIVRLEVVLRVDLKKALGGECGPCLLRVASSPDFGGPLRMLAFQEQPAKAHEEAAAPKSPNFRLWHVAPSDQMDGEALRAEVQVKASLPSSQGIIDAVFLDSTAASTDTPCVRIWTASYELWDVDFSQDGLKAQDAFAADEDVDAASKQPKLARLLGEPLKVATAPSASTSGAMVPGLETGKALKLSPLPVRTTPEQQAGMVPRLIARVVPPHVPSHMLPPPALIWSSFLDVFGKPVAGAAAAEPAAEDASRTAKETAGAASLAPQPRPRKVHVVGEEWMDQLVAEALG